MPHLGRLKFTEAAPFLLEPLQDAGVIGQASLALIMIKPMDAVPALKSRMSFPSLETRCWLLDAIAGLGAKSDAPFIAGYLYDADSVGIASCAARALAALTGEDFGFPRASGFYDPLAPVLKARQWWDAQQKSSN